MTRDYFKQSKYNPHFVPNNYQDTSIGRLETKINKVARFLCRRFLRGMCKH